MLLRLQHLGPNDLTVNVILCIVAEDCRILCFDQIYKNPTTEVNMQTKGDIPRIIRNDGNLYEGNLVHYFRVVFNKARNLRHPYHNFRHMFHVLWLCYDACLYYQSGLIPRQMRNLLIAAMFHDFDHSGLLGDDDINIERSCRGLKRNLLPVDESDVDEIVKLIKATEYPYGVSSADLELAGQIIRDADLSQFLSVAWVQQVIFGLATEWNISPIEVFRRQGPFMQSLKFHTAWARQLFPQACITEKIEEAMEYLTLLDDRPAASPVQT